MSALGQKQTCAAQQRMSPLPPNADTRAPVCEAPPFKRPGSLLRMTVIERCGRSLLHLDAGGLDQRTEAMDVEGLEDLLKAIESGTVRTVARDLTQPSPLALEVLSA